jgi:hypothetical protein
MDLRQLKMQGWTTKVDSIEAGENEFDGVTRKVALLDSENRTTLDRHNIGGVAAADASAGVRSSMHGGDESTRRKQTQGVNLHRRWTRTEYEKCDLGGERFTSLCKLDQANVRWRIGNERIKRT